MVEPKNEIQQAFQNGIEEVYSTLLCNHVKLHFLDESQTVVDDLYGEAQEKKYKEPYELIGKLDYTFNKGADVDETVERTASLKCPTKQFTTLGIPFLSEEDWEEFRKAKVTYEGTEFLITNVTPTTLVAELWQFLTFDLLEDKKSSVVR